MRRTLAQILQEADAIIEKRASAAVAEQPPPEEDGVLKLAREIMSEGDESAETPPISFDSLNENEKFAHALAILETVLSGEELAKLAHFEAEAEKQGIPPEEVQAVFDKVASKSNTGRRVVQLFEGIGETLQNVANVPVTGGQPMKAVGRAIGYAAPAAGIAYAGKKWGEKDKENQIRKEMGIG